jgi:hypothetical protein
MKKSPWCRTGELAELVDEEADGSVECVAYGPVVCLSPGVEVLNCMIARGNGDEIAVAAKVDWYKEIFELSEFCCSDSCISEKLTSCDLASFR